VFVTITKTIRSQDALSLIGTSSPKGEEYSQRVFSLTSAIGVDSDGTKEVGLTSKRTREGGPALGTVHSCLDYKHMQSVDIYP
jgi:hypothetical protein